MTGVIGWMWRKLVEYSSGADYDSLPAGRFVLRSNLEVNLFLTVVVNLEGSGFKDPETCK